LLSCDICPLGTNKNVNSGKKRETEETRNIIIERIKDNEEKSTYIIKNERNMKINNLTTEVNIYEINNDKECIIRKGEECLLCQKGNACEEDSHCLIKTKEKCIKCKDGYNLKEN